MNNQKQLNLAIFLIALITLTLELTLMRVFDVLWYPNMAYMIITLAMFAFAFSGVYVSLRPVAKGKSVRPRLALLALLLGIFALAILPAINNLQIDFSKFLTENNNQSITFFVLYIILALPFFIAGIVFSTVFSTWPENIQKLYFWDLSGAALGSVILIPILPIIGPGGILVFLLGLSIFTAGLFLEKKRWFNISVIVSLATIASAFLLPVELLTFEEHISKRNLVTYRAMQKIEYEVWDPTSKIDVANHADGLKIIFYDGGLQVSEIVEFDGDLKKLRQSLPDNYKRHFTMLRRLTVHALKENTDQNVLLIGSAGGQDIKAALVYGAKHIDAVELVSTVVDLGKEKYASFNGNIYNHPNVDAYAAEGRSFIRATDTKYDIIQIFSNHTSSSIAAGSGAMATTYLQTAEAYEEYFSHLKPDGILQVNHHIYPKMVVTAALAWKNMGLKNFRKHVVVCESGTLPTFLVKMTPWTEAEIPIIERYQKGSGRCTENPFKPKLSNLSDQFYEGKLDPDYSNTLAFRADPSTDDKPYFNHIRKSLGEVEDNKEVYIEDMIKSLLDTQARGSVLPRDVIHLFVTGAASMLAVVLFLAIPLLFSRSRKLKWRGKSYSLLYFSCLGAGFIIVELVFIQIFMKLVGYPLYTYSTVVFGLLLAAGCGSYLSGKLKITPNNKWIYPFLGMFLSIILFILVYQDLFRVFLAWPIFARSIMAILLMFPMGLFMGMLFPLGILLLKDEPRGSIAWAWAMNGLFTVVGGLLSVFLSIYLGFTITLIIALLIYVVGLIAFVPFRNNILVGS